MYCTENLGCRLLIIQSAEVTESKQDTVETEGFVVAVDRQYCIRRIVILYYHCALVTRRAAALWTAASDDS